MKSLQLFYKNWIVHNMIGHPLMQIFSLFRFEGIADKIHNGTLPLKENELKQLKEAGK